MRCAPRRVFQFFDAGRQRDQRVGERVFDVVRIGDQHALAVAIDDVRGHADDGGVGRHVGEDHGAGADARVFADGDIAEHVGVVADEDAVADGGVALAVAFAGAAQGDALIDGDVAADDRGFADDDAGGVIDEEPTAEQRAGMNIDAGDRSGRSAKERARAAAALRARAGGRCGEPDRPEARIAEQTSSRERAAGSRSRTERMSSRMRANMG